MCRTDPFRKAGETMPTERNNRQLSEISDSLEFRAERTAWAVNSRVIGSDSNEEANKRAKAEILASMTELQRETRREALLEAARIAEKCMTGERAAAELERKAKEEGNGARNL